MCSSFPATARLRPSAPSGPATPLWPITCWRAAAERGCGRPVSTYDIPALKFSRRTVLQNRNPAATLVWNKQHMDDLDLSRAQGASAHILMVDDDPGIRDVVSEFLTRHGYTVETAADAAAMERVLERGDVYLMVLDVMLPGEDGLSICRRLAGTGGPPIIMLSAMGEDTDHI